MTSNLPFSVSSFSHTSTFYDYNLHPIEQAEPLPLPIWNDVGNVNNHPPLHLSRVYPRLEPLVNIYARWPQDELKRWEAGEEKDYKKIRPFKENLAVFDYLDTDEMKEALLLRDMELPFKVRNVPDLDEASRKWDNPDYLLHGINDGGYGGYKGTGVRGRRDGIKKVQYKVEMIEGSNFFTWYDPRTVSTWRESGIPGARSWMEPNKFLPDNTHAEEFLHHAIKGDIDGDIGTKDNHLYLSLGVKGGSSGRDTFIGRDLPFFADGKENFFVFDWSQNKGIQCRIGERGVTAAVHYDNGRNSIVMVKGAKRYVLLPPNQCWRMHIKKERFNPSRRHSLLNFAGIGKRGWEEGEEAKQLKDAGNALAVETIVKEGEVLYIPSRWFHYITSLQFSAQCNSRSGKNKVSDERKWDVKGSKVEGGDGGRASTFLYGGLREIERCLEVS